MQHEGASGGSPGVAPAQQAAFRSYLSQLIQTPPFAFAPRRTELLCYVAERALRGEAATITEYGIGVEVYRKPESFDPRADSTVRSDMNRLRRALEEYYQGPGRGDPWRIEFPSRRYTPVISATAAGVRPSGLLSEFGLGVWNRPWVFVSTIGLLILGGFALWRAWR